MKNHRNTRRAAEIEAVVLAQFANADQDRSTRDLWNERVSQTGLQHALNRLVAAGVLVRGVRAVRTGQIGRPGYRYRLAAANDSKGHAA